MMTPEQLEILDCLVHPLIDKLVLGNVSDNELDTHTNRYLEQAFNQTHRKSLLQSMEYLLATNKEAGRCLARQLLIRTGSLQEIREFCLSERRHLGEIGKTVVFLLKYIEKPQFQEDDFSDEAVFSVVVKLKLWELLIDYELTIN